MGLLGSDDELLERLGGFHPDRLVQPHQAVLLGFGDGLVEQHPRRACGNRFAGGSITSEDLPLDLCPIVEDQIAARTKMPTFLDVESGRMEGNGGEDGLCGGGAIR